VANPKHKQFMVFARSTPLRRDDPVYPRGTSLLAIRESTINLFSSAQKGSLYLALILFRV